MHAANPVDEKDDLGGIGVDVGNHLEDDGAHDTLLEPGIGRWRCPDSAKVRAERSGIQRR